MKHIVYLILLVAMTGCYCPHTHPQGDKHDYSWWSYSQSIVNNTGYTLEVFQDGVSICKNLEVGQVLPIRPGLFRRYTTVVVTARKDGTYIGSNSFTFQYNVADCWDVDRVYRPQTRQ